MEARKEIKLEEENLRRVFEVFGREYLSWFCSVVEDYEEPENEVYRKAYLKAGVVLTGLSEVDYFSPYLKIFENNYTDPDFNEKSEELINYFLEDTPEAFFYSLIEAVNKKLEKKKRENILLNIYPVYEYTDYGKVELLALEEVKTVLVDTVVKSLDVF